MRNRIPRHDRSSASRALPSMNETPRCVDRVLSFSLSLCERVGVKDSTPFESFARRSPHPAFGHLLPRGEGRECRHIETRTADEPRTLAGALRGDIFNCSFCQPGKADVLQPTEAPAPCRFTRGYDRFVRRLRCPKPFVAASSMLREPCSSPSRLSRAACWRSRRS